MRKAGCTGLCVLVPLNAALSASPAQRTGRACGLSMGRTSTRASPGEGSTQQSLLPAWASSHPPCTVLQAAAGIHTDQAHPQCWQVPRECWPGPSAVLAMFLD